MPRLEEFEKWIDENFDSQEEAATVIGTTQTTISKWIGGKNGISKAFQKKLRKLKFFGPLEIPAEATISRQEFDELCEAVEDAYAVISALLKSLPEGSRPMALPKRFR